MLIKTNYTSITSLDSRFRGNDDERRKPLPTPSFPNDRKIGRASDHIFHRIGNPVKHVRPKPLIISRHSRESGNPVKHARRQPLLSYLISLLTCLSLTGCGFHLRGDIALPSELERVQVTGDDRELVAGLSDALERQGAVVDSASDSARIDVVAADFQRRVLTTDARGRATAYRLRYRVEFNVTAADGTLLQSAESVTVERAYNYNPNRELQSEQEERFLKSEMSRQAVLRMLQRLARL